MADRNAAQRARQKAHKAAGFCRCGREPATGMKSCPPCLEADRVAARRRYVKHRERLCAESRDWRARNVDRAKAAGRAKWQATKANPAKLAKAKAENTERRLQREFGLTAAQVLQMHQAQGGACDICKRSFEGSGSRGSKKRHIDHCHKTGKVRALLCARCNLSVGHLEAWDAQGILMPMCAYILRHRGTG